MPSEEDFESLKAHIKSNAPEEVKKMLQRADAKMLLNMKDINGRTALMHACFNDDNDGAVHKAMSLDMIKLLFTEIKRIDGKKFLKEALSERTLYGRPCLMLVCHFSPSHEIIQFVIDTIIEVDGHGFLREQLEVKSTNCKTTSFDAACRNSSITTESLVLLSTLLFEFDLFKKQYDELSVYATLRINSNNLNGTWSPNKHCQDQLCFPTVVGGFQYLNFATDATKCASYMKTLLVYTPNAALNYISANRLFSKADYYHQAQPTDKLKDLLKLQWFLAIDKLSPQTLVTICAMLNERRNLSNRANGTSHFKRQYHSLNDDEKTRLTNQGIDADWTPKKQITNLLQSNDPCQAFHQFNVFCKHISDYSFDNALDFLNDNALHSERFIDVFAAPSFVNYLVSRRTHQTRPFMEPVDHIYSRLMLRTFQKIIFISDQEAVARKQILQENVIDAMSLRQQAFQDLAVCVHEDALKSSLEEFRNLYFDFFKKKIELEEEAARREVIQIESPLALLLDYQEGYESVSIERSCFIKNSSEASRVRTKFLVESAPLKRIAKKHNIPLCEVVLQKLTKESVMLTGEFEVLDKSRLDEMGIGKEDRLKILRLVGLHKNEELVELRTENREMKKRAQETEKRSELKDSLSTLQQEKMTLIIKLRDSPEKARWLDSINHSMSIKTATLDELEQVVNDLEDHILDLTELVEHEKTSSPRSTDNTGQAQTQVHGNADDDEEVQDDGFSERSSDDRKSESTSKLQVPASQTTALLTQDKVDVASSSAGAHTSAPSDLPSNRDEFSSNKPK